MLSTLPSSPVTYFRPRKPGPESLIESTVAGQISTLFQANHQPLWTGGSLPLGAGMPDLVVVASHPQLFALTQVDLPNTTLLAYLRAVGRARPDTIAERMGCTREVIVRCLDGLTKAEVVSLDSGNFSLAPIWREILSEITTIEVKVANWQKAVVQAARNSIFAHRSFVAMPKSVASRIRVEPMFKHFGIGLLAVDDEQNVTLVRRPRRRQPKNWSYYYKLAAIVAQNSKL